jgi:hypothetical protein
VASLGATWCHRAPPGSTARPPSRRGLLESCCTEEADGAAGCAAVAAGPADPRGVEGNFGALPRGSKLPSTPTSPGLMGLVGPARSSAKAALGVAEGSRAPGWTQDLRPGPPRGRCRPAPRRRDGLARPAVCARRAPCQPAQMRHRAGPSKPKCVIAQVTTRGQRPAERAPPPGASRVTHVTVAGEPGGARRRAQGFPGWSIPSPSSRQPNSGPDGTGQAARVWRLDAARPVCSADGPDEGDRAGARPKGFHPSRSPKYPRRRQALRTLAQEVSGRVGWGLCETCGCGGWRGWRIFGPGVAGGATGVSGWGGGGSGRRGRGGGLGLQRRRGRRPRGPGRPGWCGRRRDGRRRCGTPARPARLRGWGGR